mmetsp:Transcript_53203/g.134397  ORF Transcript_53203/g.134397 Transcript_53203/m.134397 type:complete len:245 (-) Transcript_53203:72-806(-)
MHWSIAAAPRRCSHNAEVGSLSKPRRPHAAAGFKEALCNTSRPCANLPHWLDVNERVSMDDDAGNAIPAEAKLRRWHRRFSAIASTSGRPCASVRPVDDNNNRKLMAFKVATNMRCSRTGFGDCCSTLPARPSAKPHALASWANNARVIAELSNSKTFRFSTGSTKAALWCNGIALSISRCRLSKCAGRLGWERWQKAHESPLLHWPTAKYKHGRKHTLGCPMLPRLQAEPSRTCASDCGAPRG